MPTQLLSAQNQSHRYCDAPPESFSSADPVPRRERYKPTPNPRLHPMKTRRRAAIARHRSKTPTINFHRQSRSSVDIDVALFTHAALNPPSALFLALRERNFPAHGDCRHRVADIAWAASCLYPMAKPSGNLPHCSTPTAAGVSIKLMMHRRVLPTIPRW